MMTPLESSRVRWALLLALGTAIPAGVCLVTPPLAHASVAQHTVTPDNVDEQKHIDVDVETLASGGVRLTVTVERAMVVYPPEVTLREGAAATEVPWPDPDADPLSATIEIPAADADTATVSVFRDMGLIGHHYVVTIADWVERDE